MLQRFLRVAGIKEKLSEHKMNSRIVRVGVDHAHQLLLGRADVEPPSFIFRQEKLMPLNMARGVQRSKIHISQIGVERFLVLVAGGISIALGPEGQRILWVGLKCVFGKLQSIVVVALAHVNLGDAVQKRGLVWRQLKRICTYSTPSRANRARPETSDSDRRLDIKGSKRSAKP